MLRVCVREAIGPNSGALALTMSDFSALFVALRHLDDCSSREESSR
jgi:hypothetical protein